ATYERFTSIGPLMEKIGNGGKGIAWNTQSEMDLLRKLNYTKAEGPAINQQAFTEITHPLVILIQLLTTSER
ncbi:hypothetical protein ACUOFC_67895, partial [Escherichia sp. TWPC-MK]